MMEARTVKHVLAAFSAALACAAPGGAIAQLAASEGGGARATHGLQEPSLTRPETWLKGGNPPRTATESTVKAQPAIEPAPTQPESGAAAKIDIGVGPKADTALLPRDGDGAMRENEESERSAPRGAREAARDPCLRSSDPKCYERHKDHYHPYLGYIPGPTQTVAPAMGATNAAAAGGTVDVRIAPASAALAAAGTATPQTLEQPLVFFDPPPKKHRRGK